MITFADVLSDFLAARGNSYHLFYANKGHLDYYYTEDPATEKIYHSIYRWGFNLDDGTIEVSISQSERRTSMFGKIRSSKSADYTKSYRLDEPVSSLEALLPTEIVLDIALQLARINAKKYDLDDREVFIPKA